MENLSAVIFYSISLLLVAGAFCVIFSKRIMTALFGAFLLFLMFGALYYLLNATFNSALTVLINAVGVMVLFMFLAILMPQKDEKTLWLSFRPGMFVSAIALILFFAAILWALMDNYLERISDVLFSFNALERISNTAYIVGEKLITNYALAFEITGFVITAVVVGAGMIGIFRRNEENR